MKCICILTFLTIYMWDPVSGESHYTIIAPGIINTNRKYTVAVAIHESNGPSSIKISINGPLFNVSQEISLRSYETKIVQFNVTELEDTSYYLEVVGKGGIEFQNSSKLIANPYAAPNVHIQTDAIIYKPGDLVNFRVIIFDEDTRPFQTNETINVEILDGNSNSINKFSNIHLHKGIYEGNFSIAQYPPLGVWMILVTIGGQYGTTDVKTITVDHYELPEFAVYIEGSRHAVLEDGVIRVKVYGKYTYDRYVKGTLKTYLKTDLSVGAIMEEIYSITNTIDVEFKFDPKRFSKKRYILITAELKEENTGVTQTNSFEIVLHTQLYRISVDRLSIVQLNNATYQLKAKVTYWNETHVEDPGHVVIMEHGTKQYKAYLDEKSEATFEYEHVASANYTFHFGKSSYSMKNIMDINVYTEDYKESLLTLNLLTKRLVLGVPIQIEVKSDNDIPYFFYTIVSHGNIVQMDYIKVSGTQKNKYDLQIMPTIAMVPALFLYVHYIQNGKLHYKEMLLKFPLEFENKISLESPKTLQPGEKVNLTIKAQKNSRVCLMAVDKRVYLSNSRFDINIKDIWRKLQTDISYLPTAAVQYPGTLAGVITLTNAHFNYVLPKQITTSRGINVDKNSDPKIDIIYDLVPQRWLRRKFPNTWIFQTLDIAEEETQLTLQLPDTITTWRLTAFSLHEDSGFGIVNKPINILVTKGFFIHLDLPYSVKLGEMFLVPITIVSNHNESIVADITVLPNDEEYIIIGAKDNPKKFQKTIDLSANGIETIEFSLIATKIGEIFLKVVGQSDLFTDAIERKLLVEPEGSLHQGHRIMYIDASAIGVFNKILFLNIPTDIVPDSEYIAMYIGGDTLMPSIESIRNSIRMPTGNGEENMVKFVSSILIMDYLISMDLHSKAKHLVDKAKLFLDMGYQQQLAFCHSSGGYSTFGQNEDSEASTWLTAHTVRFFIKAQKYLGIRDDMIERGLDFLATNQRVRGDFLFTGKLSHPPGQNLYGFTSFVLLAFFEDKRFAIKYNTTIQNALKFLTANIDKVHNIYDLSLVAHILQKAEHPMFSDIWPNILEQQNEMGYRRWWLGKVANMKKSVEITSYVLMTQLALNQSSLTEDHDILRWLLEQCDQMNGIASAHNTVLRLEALAKFSEKYSHLHDVNMSIRYTAKNRNHDILDQGAKVISSNMSFNLQTMELPKPSRTLDIEANGMGHVLLQVSYRYHKIDEDNISPNFHIQPKAEMKNIDVLQLEVCFSYESFNTEENLKENLIKTDPSMIIMEVNFPSGFMASHENKYNISKHTLVKKIESKNHEGSLIIYIQRYEKGASGCFHFEAHRRHHVKQIKRAAIVIYDSYNLSRHDTVFYDCPLDKVETVFRFSSQTEDNQHTSNNPGIEKTSEYRQTYLGRSVNDNTDGGTLMDNPHENNASHTTLLHRASENMFPLKFSRSPKSFKINGSNFMGTTNGEPYSFDNLTLQLVNLYPLVYKGGSQYFQINEGYKLLNSSQMLMDICFQYKNKYFEKDEFNSSYIIMQVYLPKEFKIKKVQPRDDIWQMGKKSYSLHNFESEVIIHFGNLATNESRCINITSDILAYGQFSQYGKIFIYDIHNLTRYGITNITNISEKLYGPHEKVPTLVLLHDFKDQMANFESIGKNDTNETTFYNSNRLRVIEEKISHLNDEINKLTMEISYLKESTIKDSKPINGKYRNPSMSTIEEADPKLEFKLNSISNDIVVIKNGIQKIFNRIDIILEEKVNIDLPSADREIFRTNEDPIYLKRRSVEVEDLNHAITNISQKLRKTMGNMPIEINELKNVNQQNSDEVTKLVAVISKIKQDLISLKDDNQKMWNEIAVLNQKILEENKQ